MQFPRRDYEIIRAFLLAACKHFLSNERDRRRAKKRGGHRLGFSLDFIAAEKLSRICYAMEREPTYVDVAIKRWESFTGETAVKEVGE